MTTATSLAAGTTSADAELLAVPPSWLSGRVHSAFPSVVNISPATGDLWCVATRGVAPGPRTMITNLAALDLGAIRAGLPVTVAGTRITIGADLRIEFGDAARWEVPTLIGAPSPERIHALASALEAVGIRGGALPVHPTDLDQPAARHTSIDDAVSARVSAALHELIASVRHGHSADITDAATHLVGLGLGLTPTGDDVLTGFGYAAASLGGPLDSAPAAIAPAASPQATNEISLVALHQACRGRAHQHLVDLLAAVCGETGDILRATTTLVTIGHTSGTDQAVGLLAAVRLYQEMRGQ